MLTTEAPDRVPGEGTSSVPGNMTVASGRSASDQAAAPQFHRDSSVATGSAAFVAAVAALSTAAGFGLGLVGRAGTNAGPDTTGRVLAGLSDLGSPWILTAFATGAAGVLIARRRHQTTLSGIMVGRVAAAWALVCATFTYYHTEGGLLSALSHGPYVLAWLIVGLAVGLAFGSLGALWAENRATPLATAAATILALTVAGEACLAIGRNSAGDEQAVHNLHLTLVFVGIAIAAVAAHGRSKVMAVGTTIVLAWPTAVFVGFLYRAVGVLYNVLR